MSAIMKYVKERTGRTTRLSKQMTAEIVDRALKVGMETPLEMLFQVMNSDIPPQEPNETPFDFKLRSTEHMKLKLEAAKAAAPYVHPRMVALDPGNTVEDGASERQLILVPVAKKKSDESAA